MSDNISPLTMGDSSPVSVSAHAAGTSEVEVKTLKKFTLFPKLPLELRRKVYRWSFPQGRLVSARKELLAPNQHPIEDERALRIRTALTGGDSRAHPPITLFVNKESREETLRHYCVLFRTDDPDDDSGRYESLHHPRRPFCFNPDLDTWYATQMSFFHWNSGPWIQFIKRKHPSVLDSVRTLQWRVYDGCVPRWKRRDGKGCHSSHYALLLEFNLLETLEYVYTSPKKPSFDSREKVESVAREIIADFVEDHKEFYGDRKLVCTFRDAEQA